MDQRKNRFLLLLSAWAQLGWYDIRSKYRRTYLGPLWISLSTAMSVGFLGIVYGSLFNTQWKVYLPYVTAGIISWSLISSFITEGSLAAINYKHVFHSLPLNPMFPVVRIVVKATIIFLHNIIVFFVVSIICEVQINLNQLFILPALLIYLINGLWAGLLLAIICARYRDMQPLITAVIGVLFLITPVLWFPGMLTDHRRFIALFNPLTHYIAIVREPMLGISPDLMSWYLVLFLTVMGVLVTKLVYRVIRTKLILWL